MGHLVEGSEREKSLGKAQLSMLSSHQEEHYCSSFARASSLVLMEESAAWEEPATALFLSLRSVHHCSGPGWNGRSCS